MCLFLQVQHINVTFRAFRWLQSVDERFLKYQSAVHTLLCFNDVRCHGAFAQQTGADPEIELNRIANQVWS